MITKIENVNIPESWTTDYLLKFAYNIRPDWSVCLDYYKEWIDIGIDSTNNKGLEWLFLVKEDFYKQGGKEEPTLSNYKIAHWWLSKIMPGCVLPLHFDGPRYDSKQRAFCALTDYQTGHIFLYQDTLWTNYQRGDTYLMEDKIHGAANLTTQPKLTLQMIIEPVS